MPLKRDPGPCPVDDAPHTTCVSADYAGALMIPQTPCRDGIAPVPTVGAIRVPALVGQVVQTTLPEGAATTATYGQSTTRFFKRKPEEKGRR
jgi:hypothetical protein